LLGRKLYYLSFEYQEAVAEHFLTKWRGKPCQYLLN
jgi:hypothetical protein